MNQTSRLAGPIGVVFCGALLGALTGCTTYVEQPRAREVYAPAPPPQVYVAPPPVYVPPPPVFVSPPVVEVSFAIRTESDFYEPLTPYGRWEFIGGSGRCWIPGRVEADWRPYTNGHWERTDAGWYWASDEPWAWATYHYGRWDSSPQFGWYWVPQTQWAPAWVSFHRGGGYVGWAPLQPSARIASGELVEVNVGRIAPRSFVFVEEQHFMKPVRPATVVVNNTTIINKTVNITNIKIVNNTVINEGPRTTIIEQASGQTIQAVPVHELRRKQEADVVATRRIAAPPVIENKVPLPVVREVSPRVRSIQKPALIAPEPANPTLQRPLVERARVQPVPTPVEAKPEVKREPTPSFRPQTIAPVIENKVQAPVVTEAPPRIPPIQKLPVIALEPAAPAPEKPLVERVRIRPVPVLTEAKPEVIRDARPLIRPETRPAENTVINDSPRPTGNEQGRGQKVPPDPFVRPRVAPRPGTVPAIEPRSTERPVVIPHEPAAPAAVERARGRPIPIPVEAKPEVRQETKPAGNHGAERVVREKQNGNKKSGGTNTVDKARPGKIEEPQIPPEKPPLPK